MVIAWTDAVLSESVTTLSLLECAVHTQETVISCNLLQLVTLLATCFGLTGPSSGLQQMVLTKVHILVVPMGSNHEPAIPQDTGLLSAPIGAPQFYISYTFYYSIVLSNN